jgi:predicted protein tyrosine phosphatase
MRAIAIPKIFAEHTKQRLLSEDNVAIISILDTDAKRLFKNIPGKALTVWFDDIHPTTTCTLASCMDFKAADSNDAFEIIHFIKHLPTNIDTIFVHCTAGICRSGAVVDFLRVVKDVDDIQFKQDNPNIIPNEWVRDLLWMTWKMKGQK